MTSLCLHLLGCALGVALLSGDLGAQDPPYTLEQVARLVESGVFGDDRILNLVDQSCLGFRLDDAAEGRLRSVGASDVLIDGLRQVCVKLSVAVHTIEIQPSQLELAVGGAGGLTVRALAADSTILPEVSVTWSSADTAIADVLSNGFVIAKRLGETSITARAATGAVDTLVVRVSEALASGVTAQKSPAMAAVLGIVPGGGEFYTGNRTKGIIVLAGTAGALAAGFLITSEDTVPASPLLSESCEDGSCRLLVTGVSEVQRTSDPIVALVVAGSFWAFGLVDGILAARRTRKPAVDEFAAAQSAALSLELLPSDGVRITRSEIDITLLRLR